MKDFTLNQLMNNGHDPFVEPPAPCVPSEAAGSVVDLAKIAELGQAYAQFELIRTMATQAQTRFGKHLSAADVERMGEIATLADITIGYIMAAYDAAK